jgi:YVTN family beta-propeller protein
MKYGLLLVILMGGYGISFAQTDTTARRIQLPNGWSLTPLGHSIALGDLPLNLVVSPSKKWLAVTNNGQSIQTIQLIDAKTGRILSEKIIPESWLGLAFSSDEHYLYASGGNYNLIVKYRIDQNHRLIDDDQIKLGEKWPVKISPAGMQLDDKSNTLYVVTKENNSLYIVNISSKKSHAVSLGAEAYTCLLSKDRAELYISLWGGGQVLIYNIKKNQITETITVGDHPNDLCLSRDGRLLFVANANDNSVSVVDIQKRKLLETLDAALYPGSPAGSTSNGVALSEDGKTLYTANADNNCLVVFDVSNPGSSRSTGFIPVGWYPTGVKVIGKKNICNQRKGIYIFSQSSIPTLRYHPCQHFFSEVCREDGVYRRSFYWNTQYF